MKVFNHTSSSREIAKSAAIQKTKKLNCFVANTPRNDKLNSQNGSVFFYIILAIMLIAGLTYALSSGNRNSASILTNEQARVAATEIIEYGNTVANAVQKLKLRGCSDTEISFENNISSTSYTNSNSPSDKSCHIFKTEGGNINWISPDENYSNGVEWNITGRVIIAGFGGSDVILTSDSDLVLDLKDIPQNICDAINNSFNISPTPVDDGEYVDTPQFTGTYPLVSGGGECISGHPTNSCNDTANPLYGIASGCFYEEDAPNRYVFFQLLLAR